MTKRLLNHATRFHKNEQSPYRSQISSLLLLLTAIGYPTHSATAYQTSSNTPPATSTATENGDRLKVERLAPLSIEDVKRAIEVLPGYEVELVASEPLIGSPVAMEFDADGFLWVVEMVDYSEQENEALGRVSRLQDTDQDGVMDYADVIAEKISWPTALTTLRGKTWVAAPPYILEYPDGNRQSKQIIDGFGRQNVQGLANSFRWGLDGKLHLSTSSNGGKLQISDSDRKPSLHLPSTPYSVSGRDVVFDLITGEISSVVGYGQHGFDFGPWGDRFVTANSDHLQQVVAWYLPELTDASLSKSVSWRRSIAVDGPQAEVFRISPVESWRSIRTQMRLSGMSNGILEGGGQASGYFTSATGVTVYDGDQWGEEKSYAFIADVGSNLVHRKQLTRNGVASSGQRVDKDTEFLRSRDTWFRPVQFANGPDGCLYVVDMARETIEHPKSIPEPIKSQVDLTSGRELGRIWRIKAQGRSVRRTTPELSKYSTAELCKLLDHPNGWHRETASRLLIERQDPQAVSLCRSMLSSNALLSNSTVPSTQKSSGTSPFGRIHALSVLASLPNGLNLDSWYAAIRDTEPRIRVWAWVLANRIPKETFASDEFDKSMLATLMTEETDLEVQMVMAVRSNLLTLPAKTLANVFAGWLTDEKQSGSQLKSEELRAAIELAIRDQGAQELWESRDWMTVFRDNIGESYLDAMFSAMQRQGSLSAAMTQWLERLQNTDTTSNNIPSDQFPTIVRILGRQIERKLFSEDSEVFRYTQKFANNEIKPRVEKMLIAARDASNASSTKEDSISTLFAPTQETRLGAIRLLSLLPEAQRVDLFQRMITSPTPITIQRDWIEAWVPNMPVLQEIAIAELNNVSPVSAQSIIKSLIRSETGAQRLLQWVEKPENSPASIPAWAWQTLRAFPSESVKTAAQRIAPSSEVLWESIASDYRKAWERVGNAEKGEQHFRRLCASCHRVGEVGIAIGPSLDSYRVRPNESIGLAIAEPSREMDPKYEQQQIATVNGEVMVGILLSATSEAVTLHTAQNQILSVPRKDIETWKAGGKSLMPDGLLKELDPTAMTDLIAFLRRVPSSAN